MEFPKYIGFGSSEKPYLCLRLLYVEEDVATYERPPDTGCWKCDVMYKDAILVVTDCLGAHLIGCEVFECTKEQFDKDNGYAQQEKK